MHRVDDVLLDLNLLRVFDALMHEHNVTRAARRLGVTQPAISRSLTRLRRVFGDTLFVRTRTEMVATPRARALAGRIQKLLEELKGLTREEEPFVPADARRRFTLCTSDYAQCVIVPPFVASLTRGAPGIALDALPWTHDFLPALESGAVDLVLSPQVSETRGIYVKKLFTERFVCIVRNGHPLVRDSLPLSLFTRLDHAIISPGGRPGSLVDEALARKGKRRHVALTLPSFITVPLVVATTDLISTVPERIAWAFARSHDLRVLTCPVEVPGLTMLQVWHERLHSDPGHTWLRQELSAVCQRLTP